MDRLCYCRLNCGAWRRLSFLFVCLFGGPEAGDEDGARWGHVQNSNRCPNCNLSFNLWCLCVVMLGYNLNIPLCCFNFRKTVVNRVFNFGWVGTPVTNKVTEEMIWKAVPWFFEIRIRTCNIVCGISGKFNVLRKSPLVGISSPTSLKAGRQMESETRWVR